MKLADQVPDLAGVVEHRLVLGDLLVVQHSRHGLVVRVIPLSE